MDKIKRVIPQISIIAFAFFIYHRWLNFSIFRYGDYQFYFAKTLREYLSPVMWSNWYNFGGIDSMFWRLPWNFLYGIFGKFGFDSNIADRFLLLWPLIVILPIASFLLVRKITGSNIGAVIGSFVFSYNTYYLAVDTQGQLLFPIAGGFAVLAIWLFIKDLEDRSFPLAVVTGLTLFVTGFLDLRVAYMTIFLLVFYALYQIFIIDSSSSCQEKLRLASQAFIPLIIVALLNFYWLIGLLSGNSILSSGVLTRGLFGGISLNLRESLTLFYPFWNGSQPVWFVPQNIPFYFWIIPIVALLGLWLNRKNPEVLFFGFISILGIFLTKQTDLPFGGIYSWLFAHFPGFDAFREASKFYFLIALGYSVLIGSFVAFIWRRASKNRWQSYAKYPIIVVVAFMFLWNTKPIITGEIGSMWVPRHIEQDYFTLNNFVDKQPGYFVTLAVPTNSNWETTTSNHPIASLVQLGGTNWKDFVDYADHDIYTWPIQEAVVDPLKNLFFSQLTDVSSIKYVVISTEDVANDSNPFSDYGGAYNPNIRQWYIDQLDKVKWLKKIDIGTKDLVMYENANYRPHIYITVKPETIQTDVKYQPVDFQPINPTEYKVELTGIATTTYLNFSEAYHPEWRLRAGDFNWFSVLLNKNYFLDGNNHFKNDANLNSFLIDPQKICSDFQCTKNEDGSYDINLTLYFKPQSYFYLGLIISGTTLLGCLGYLGLALLNNFGFFVRKKEE